MSIGGLQAHVNSRPWSKLPWGRLPDSAFEFLEKRFTEKSPDVPVYNHDFDLK